MHKVILAMAGALALACCHDAHAANKQPDGYAASDAALASTLTPYVALRYPRLRPQMRYAVGPMPYFEIISPGNAAASGLSVGQGMGINVAGNVLGAAIASAAALEQAQKFSQRNFDAVEYAHCDLPIEGLQRSVESAIRRSSWGTATEPKHVVSDGRQALDKLTPKDQPRHLFVVSASFTPEMSHLVTSVDVMAFAPPENSDSAWKKKPRWQDRLVVVSDPLPLSPKTAEDVAAMTAAEHARYAASGTEALVAKVNAKGFYADKTERRKATAAAALHRNNLEAAAQPQWSPESEALRRGQLWAENDCARVRAALAHGDSEIGGMLDALFTQQLPPRPAAPDQKGADQATDPAAGGRQVHSLADGVYVSRSDGDAADLSFRYWLLLPDK